MLRRITGVLWFVLCLMGGTTLINLELRAGNGKFLPIYFLIWILYFFAGHAFIGWIFSDEAKEG